MLAAACPTRAYTKPVVVVYCLGSSTQGGPRSLQQGISKGGTMPIGEAVRVELSSSWQDNELLAPVPSFNMVAQKQHDL